jgi:hypothetical protein
MPKASCTRSLGRVYRSSPPVHQRARNHRRPPGQYARVLRHHRRPSRGSIFFLVFWRRMGEVGTDGFWECGGSGDFAAFHAGACGGWEGGEEGLKVPFLHHPAPRTAPRPKDERRQISSQLCLILHSNTEYIFPMQLRGNLEEPHLFLMRTIVSKNRIHVLETLVPSFRHDEQGEQEPK